MSVLSKHYLRPRWDFLGQTKDGILTIEGIPAPQLAHKYGTPLYVMVERSIRERIREFKKAFPYPKLRVQYATKCNSNLEIMRIANEEGIELDASSTGEVILALLADFSPQEITLTNLHKTANDVMFAARIGVQAITADSFEDLELIESVGKKLRQKIRIFLRFNPIIEVGNYSTRHVQYAMPYNMYKTACEFAIKSPHLNPIGLHFSGPYVYSPRVYYLAAKKLLNIAEHLLTTYNHKISYIDLGGGFPVAYGDDEVFHPRSMGKKFVNYFINQVYKRNLPLPYLIFEPGKFCVANAGIGLTRVLSKKAFGRTRTLVVDGSAYAFLPDVLTGDHVTYDILPSTKMARRRSQHYLIAGCTCDHLDVLTKNVHLPRIDSGDLLAIMDCGAYSNTMASNFNSLKRAPMIMINEQGVPRLVRRRDRYSDMFAPELDVLKVADPHELQRYYNLFRFNIDRFRGEQNKKKKGTHKSHRSLKSKSEERMGDPSSS